MNHDNNSARPASDSARSTSDSARPASDPARSTSDSARPASDPARSTSDSARPASDPARPASDPARSTSDSARPASDPARPASDPARPSGDSARLSGDDRRRQLVGIGLRLLATTPIHEMSLDQVAAEAGISRSLLFHYFPTKRDLYAAVVRAASRRVLRQVDESIAADARPVYGLVDGLLTFIESRPEPYIAFVRGASGGDAWVLEIYEDTRSRMADRTLTALYGNVENADPMLRMAVRGWLALAEEMSLEWTLDPRLDREQLLDLLVEALHGVVKLVPPLPSAR